MRESDIERVARLRAEQEATRAARAAALLLAQPYRNTVSSLRAKNVSDMARNGQAERNRIERQDRQAMVEFRQEVRDPDGWRATVSERVSRETEAFLRTPVRSSRPAGMPHIPVVLVSATRPQKALEMVSCQMCRAAAIAEQGTVWYCTKHQGYGQAANRAECREAEDLEDQLWQMELAELASSQAKRGTVDAKVRSQQPATVPVAQVFEIGCAVMAKDRNNYGTITKILHYPEYIGMSEWTAKVLFFNNEYGTSAVVELPLAMLERVR